MKNKNPAKKILLVLISAIVLLSIFSFSAFADDGDESENKITVWELSDRDRILKGNGKEYTQISIPVGYYVDFSREYIYAYEIKSKFFDNRTYQPVSPQKNSEVVCLMNYDENTYYTYVTDDEKTSLKKFFGNSISKFRIQNPNDSMEYADISASLISELDSVAASYKKNETFEVGDLNGNLYVEFIGRNDADYMGMTYGAMYELNDNYYYLNYTKLNNGYFDAYGNFSYRSGTVSLTKIDGELFNQIEKLERTMPEHLYESEYEEDNIELDYDETGAKVLFWIIFVFFGVLVPIAPLVVGFLFARSEKRGNPKQWYLVALFSLAWMILSLILAIILIFG